MSNKLKILSLISCLFLFSLINHSCTKQVPADSGPKEYFVAASGSDSNAGTENAPFLTINHAAQLAKPGDTVTVREGIYREWVNPKFGGESEDSRITYRAARGEDVRILGSESVTGWVQQKNLTWKLSLPKSFFGDFNPFNTLTRHPLFIGARLGDGWGWLQYGRWTHLGDVIIRGNGLTEKQTLEEVSSTPWSWCTQTVDDLTTIWANFEGADPNQSGVEINVRGKAFFPATAGLSYITFKGFTVMNTANHWAPPVEYQVAAIGPNGGHHWIIEDNIILYAKAAAISIGIPTEEFDSQDQGHHMIRNNVIMRCGQGGITGCGWNSHTQIYGNHMEEINYREEFGGWETGAIKHHKGDGLIVRNNFIRGVHTADPKLGAGHGIWIDFGNTNWRVSSNIILACESHSILSEANQEGSILHENNILEGGPIATFSTRGDAWAQNLCIRTGHYWENQPWGNRPRISHQRWMNNIFVGKGLDDPADEDFPIYSRNAYMDGAKPHPDETGPVVSGTPSTVRTFASDQGIDLVFSVDEEILKESYPLIAGETWDLPFTFNAGVDTDFFGKTRSNEENVAGPFAKLHPGINRIMIYEYPALYKKALQIIGETPF